MLPSTPPACDAVRHCLGTPTACTIFDQFVTSDGQSIKAGKEEHVALVDEDVEQEQIVKQKRG